MAGRPSKKKAGKPSGGGQAPGVIHHAIIRGIERRKILRDNKDRDGMIDRLADLLPSTNTTCYVYPV